MIKERTYELNRIRQFLNRPKLGSLFIYGKENVGKDTIVHMACKDSLAKKVFINVGNENNDLIICNLISKIKAAFPDADIPNLNSVPQILKILFEQSVNQKIILIINDVHRLYRLSPDITTFFESFKNRFKANGNIKVICITSEIEAKLNYENPALRIKLLFDDYLEIDAFDYLGASSFYSRSMFEERISYYSIFGGSPLYNSMINPLKSFDKNLKELLLYKNSPLRNLIATTLYKITSKKYEIDGLLSILGKRQFSKYGELKKEFKDLGITGDFDYTLNKLVEIGIITKRAPLHFEGDKKKYFYMFADPLYNFFYSHVFNQTESDVLTEEIDKKYEAVIKNEFINTFLPQRLMFITQEFIKREGEKGKFDDQVMNVALYFPNPSLLDFNNALLVETISGNYYVIVNTSKKQITRKTVDEFAYSLYEKQRPFKKIVIVSRGLIATNIDRKKYITYHMDGIYSKA